MEKESFEEIIKNTTNINIYKYISKDSLKCIKFIKENSFTNLRTDIFNPFIIKYLIEIVQRYQQILDQFIIKSEKKRKINNSKYSKIIYLIMYLFVNKKEDYINLLNISYNKREDIDNANIFCQNIHNHRGDYINDWLNLEINSYFYNNLLKKIEYTSDNFIKNIFNDSDKNTIYNSFSSINIQNDLEKNINTIYNYEVLFSLERHTYNDDYELFLTTNQNLDNKLKYHIANLLLLSVLTENKEKIMCYYWKSKKKKKLPTKKKPLGPNEVNSGSTLLTNYIKRISIVRIEEFLKVIIHETIHNSGLDLSQYNFDIINEWIKKHFLIKSNNTILINECYVELWAVIFNSIITAHISNPSELLPTFLYIINIEKLFSCFQCAKILKYYGFNNFSEFYNNNGWSLNKLDNAKYFQKSSILSYYIIKSAVLFNIDSFFKFCYPDTYSIKNFIRFDEMSEENFLKLIISSVNNNNYQNIVNNYFNILNKNDIDDFVLNTLRMTAISLFD